ncbi:MAG: hypothetical protein L3J88_11510 [Gammaproteobacteria bacterium]|nr:hypothetical protein [Gammaproteobacteria bacterium]MCF6363944.1 hypothetical protein [Gammaproteobacteria bacterium]
MYVAEASGEPCAADDASKVQVFLPDQLPAVLAFDHALILADYRHYRETGQLAPLR